LKHPATDCFLPCRNSQSEWFQVDPRVSDGNTFQTKGTLYEDENKTHLIHKAASAPLVRAEGKPRQIFRATMGGAQLGFDVRTPGNLAKKIENNMNFNH
jgi:hypothetical protein